MKSLFQKLGFKKGTVYVTNHEEEEKKDDDIVEHKADEGEEPVVENVNLRRSGQTLLMIATVRNNVAEVARLLGKGADPTLKAPTSSLGDSGFTALHYAALRGNIEIMELLLNARDENGNPRIDPDEPSVTGKSSLQVLLSSNRTENPRRDKCISLLLQRGACGFPAGPISYRVDNEEDSALFFHASKFFNFAKDVVDLAAEQFTADHPARANFRNDVEAKKKFTTSLHRHMWSVFDHRFDDLASLTQDNFNSCAGGLSDKIANRMEEETAFDNVVLRDIFPTANSISTCRLVQTYFPITSEVNTPGGGPVGGIPLILEAPVRAIKLPRNTLNRNGENSPYTPVANPVDVNLTTNQIYNPRLPVAPAIMTVQPSFLSVAAAENMPPLIHTDGAASLSATPRPTPRGTGRPNQPRGGNSNCNVM